MKIALANIFPNPDQPRKRFAPDALSNLASSIHENGLLQPITVRSAGKGRYEIVAGERRWRAHELIGATEIEANVQEMDDASRDINAIIENLQREDITPVEEARAYKRIIDSGVEPDALAKQLGIKQPWRITERTALLNLNPEYLDLMEKGHLSASQGTELSRLAPPEQNSLFHLIRVGKCDTYSKLRSASDALLAQASQGGLFEKSKASNAEQKALSAFESKIEQVVRLVTSGFQDNEIVALKKINPHRAKIVAEQLRLIGKHLKMIEREVDRATIQHEIAA